VKTGTSKEMPDNWCVGYTQRYTVGVWVGNLSGAPMYNVSALTGAAPVWLDLMSWLHRAIPSAPPAPPPGIVLQHIRFPHDIEPERTEWFLAGMRPSVRPQVLSTAHPRIVMPVSGTIIALDSDIPPAQQRLRGQAQV
jgi:penicillin-binding protein 1C